MTPFDVFMANHVLTTAAAIAYVALVWWMLGIYGGRGD